MPDNSGRPVGDPIVVVVVDVVVVDVLVVDVLVVEVLVADASIDVEAGAESEGEAVCEDEHPAAKRSDTVTRPTRLRRTRPN
ncbi:MAG: hypothetical protein E6G39_13950 [Actinobacteria bacterium]|nr:MAG: hypothetical protein E6G39_13950 [Actinomycetota bacterium]